MDDTEAVLCVCGDVTQRQLAAAFTEWERRCRENPDAFWSESERLAASPETYGDLCTPYFLSILAEQR